MSGWQHRVDEGREHRRERARTRRQEPPEYGSRVRAEDGTSGRVVGGFVQRPVAHLGAVYVVIVQTADGSTCNVPLDAIVDIRAPE